jgi:hypothetical protein
MWGEWETKGTSRTHTEGLNIAETSKILPGQYSSARNFPGYMRFDDLQAVNTVRVCRRLQQFTNQFGLMHSIRFHHLALAPRGRFRGNIYIF